MTLKRVVNLVLLIFVTITLATFIYKEARTKNKDTTLTQESVFSEKKVEPVSEETTKSVEEFVEEAKPLLINETDEKITKMIEKTTTPKVKPQETKNVLHLEKTEAPLSQEKQINEKFIVYYFMTTTRCPSCYKIENYTYSCLLDKFSDELNSGKMEWKMVNVDEQENSHFIKKYDLFTKSVVLSKEIDGKEVQWKKLDKVWDLLNNQTNFYEYIKTETKNFIERK